MRVPAGGGGGLNPNLILFPKKMVDKTNGGVVYSNRVIKMKKYIITKEEYEAVKAAQKKNIHKRQDKLLEAVALRYEGYTDWEIAYKLGWNRQSVSRMIRTCTKIKQSRRNYRTGKNQRLRVEIT